MFKETFILQSIYKLWSRTRCQPQFQTLHSQQGWRRSAPPDRAPVVHPPLRQISRTTEGCSESDKYHHSFLKELVGEEWHGGQPDETEYKKKEKRNNSGSDTCTGGGGATLLWIQDMCESNTCWCVPFWWMVFESMRNHSSHCRKAVSTYKVQHHKTSFTVYQQYLKKARLMHNAVMSSGLWCKTLKWV